MKSKIIYGPRAPIYSVLMLIIVFDIIKYLALNKVQPLGSELPKCFS